MQKPIQHVNKDKIGFKGQCLYIVDPDWDHCHTVLLDHVTSQLAFVVGLKGSNDIPWSKDCTTDMQFGGRKRSKRLLNLKASKLPTFVSTVSATPCELALSSNIKQLRWGHLYL